ncbi:MAG: hypothetical protein GX417_01005 [Clostridiales bacterium]|nr:hypothetical protein [Clostridiales bacterium]
MAKCVNCGKERPQYVQDFLIISRSSTGGFGGMRETTERLSGAERHVVCKTCLLKKVTKNALWMMVFITVAAFLGSVFMWGDDVYHNTEPFIVLSILLGIVAGISAEVAGMFSRKRRAKQIRNFVTERNEKSDIDKIYVSVGEKLYRTEQAFLTSGVDFTTGIGSRLYSELIKTGVWKDYVAAALSQTDGETIAIPEGEHKALLTECVQELLRLYRQTPGGFLTDSAAAMPVRTVGKKLDEAGGFELMRQAHGIFAASSPGMGLARNLEMVWDGIGGWRG